MNKEKHTATVAGFAIFATETLSNNFDENKYTFSFNIEKYILTINDKIK